jgi:thiol-disulfide isomerase/thioredoxin
MRLIGQLTVIVMIMAASRSALGGGLGNTAPALQIAEWVKGGPVVLAEGKDKHVYVVEVWATTCPHSRGCIPRLTALQQKYKDQGVVLVAVSPEPVETVKAFVEERGDQIGYVVGADRLKATTRTYLKSVFVERIPYAFIVDKSGKMVWHGHPMSGLEQALVAVLAGTHDIEAARRREQARNLTTLYIQLVKSPGKAEASSEVGERILEYGAEDFLLMNDFAWRIVTEPGLIKRDLDLAMRAVQIANDATEGKNAGILDTYARVLFERGQIKEAIEYQRKAIELATTDEARQALEKTLAKYERGGTED